MILQISRSSWGIIYLALSTRRCYNLDKNNKKQITNDEWDDTMAEATQNYVYEIKIDKNKEKNEKLISKELLELCKKVAEKYPLKK